MTDRPVDDDPTYAADVTEDQELPDVDAPLPDGPVPADQGDAGEAGVSGQ